MALTTGSTMERPAETTAEHGEGSPLRPLLIDVALPLLAYYAAHSVFGLGLVASLTISSVVPAVRTGAQLVRERSLNAFAALVLVVNLVGIGLSLVTGDARLMIAKDGAISSVIGLAVLGSVLAGRPMMTAGMRPFIVKGDAAKSAAWDRLASGTAASAGATVSFRRHERAFSLVWGTVLVAECVAKVIGAYTLPVATMAWLGSVFMVCAIVLGIVVGNAFAGRLYGLVVAETEHA
ncbi:VC0807 family protein [Kitasatospora sp. NPDC056138]|uniref:VC0807 family protein n=1 Tax=Kitasatospora sp. NPDC056138 TaxID=3345724 RepID=UPI0035DAB052